MKSTKPASLLIIRFSSPGDIVMCMEAASAFKKTFPGAQVEWLVRSDFSEFLDIFPDVDKVYKLNRKDGFFGLIQLIKQIKTNSYSHIYDAHSNVRSHITCWLLLSPWKRLIGRGPKFIRRSKERLKRWLLFTCHVNNFPNPYKGALSFLTPLEKWGIEASAGTHTLNFPASPKIDRYRNFLNSAYTLAPSASFDLKKWPINYWQKLITLNPDKKFAILGGPTDLFCQEIANISPKQTLNLAGQLSWLESAQAISFSKGLISGDTGLLHIADLIGD